MAESARQAPLTLPRTTSRFPVEEVPLAVISAVILVLVGIPLLTAAVASFRPGDTLPFDAGAWTLSNFVQAFSSPLTFQLIRNTIIYTLVTLAIAIPVAFTLAWLVERTDMPFGSSMYTLILIPMSIPGLLQALGWVLLLSPRNGVINVWLRGLTGSTDATGPINLYTFPGFVFVTMLAVVPSAFIMLAGMLRNVNPQFEEAASTSGAPLLQTLRRVTMPLVTPGLLAAFVYYSIVMIEFFEIPLALAQNAQFPVLSLQIFSYTRPQAAGVPLYGLAAAYSIFGLVLGILLLWGYRRATAASQRYAVVVGKSYHRERMKLGWARVPALIFTLLYLLLAAVLPLGTLIWASVLPFYEPPSLAALGKLTGANYLALANNPRIATATLNTVIVLVAAATATVLLAALVGWVTQRKRSRASNALDLMVFLPTAVPGIVIALAVLLFYIRTPIWGTIWILVVGQVIRYLPFTTRVINSALIQIHAELEEAAWASGASRFVTFRRVLLPLLTPAIANGWVWVAVHSMRDFTFPIMLGTFGNLVLASLLWSLWERGEYSQVGAMATVLALVSMLFAFAARRFVSQSTI